MEKSSTGTRLRLIIPFLFFISCFLYFLIFNRYLLIYHEQIQLFRYELSYFREFLSVPGGLMRYTGAFFTQFYLFPLAGASIVTLAGLSIYSVTRFIFRKHHLTGVLPALVPAVLLAALHSNYLYTLACTFGLIISLGFFAIYISISNNKFRRLLGFCGWPILYFMTGGYALAAILLCFVHEFLFRQSSYHLLIASLFLLPALLVPYITSHYILYIKADMAWTFFLPLFIEGTARYLLILLLVYCPVVLIVLKGLLHFLKLESVTFQWNWKTLTAGTLIFICLSGWLITRVYDRKTEIWLGMDHCVQRSDWNGALKLSSAYPGKNRLVMYFTNLSLYKTGRMGDRLFCYPQAGIEGLWLKWERNGISPFFGGEIYYQLAYTSEAYRWAFEAMVAKGPNPRCLKRLAVTSLVNGDITLARKYLKVLDQSLFYRKWAKQYLYYTDHPELLTGDKEISEKIHFAINTDFMSSRDNSDIRLKQLLENHPDNRMAFEYIMASMLLEKDLKGIAENIYRLKDLGYKSIPAHYEEALLAYMSYAKENVIPVGYSISQTTQNLFNEYAKMFFSFNGNQDRAARDMYGKFGRTYWYYLKFINIQPR
jgi:hypothetical protein